jgi:glucokinase
VKETKTTHRVGFDLGGTKMMAAVFDGSFRLCASRKAKTKGLNGKNDCLERIRTTICGAMEDAGIEAGNLAGIGVGCPGPLDLDRGVILHAPNLGWRNVNLKSSLEKHSNAPRSSPTTSTPEPTGNIDSARAGRPLRPGHLPGNGDRRRLYL